MNAAPRNGGRLAASLLKQLGSCQHWSTAAGGWRHLSNALKPEVLLSEANRSRCIDCMQRGPPIGIKLTKHHTESAFAAVLILLCHGGDTASTVAGEEVSILYTRRSGRLSRHVRQVSFPGGMRDPSDADFVDCALRETEEEIGLSRDRIQIWGTGALMMPPHTAAIMPVIGVVENLNVSELKLNADEVDEAFTLPVSKMVQSAALRHTQFKNGYSAPVFLVGNYKVWGVTGYLTNRFLKCLIPQDVPRLKRHVKYIKPYRHHSR